MLAHRASLHRTIWEIKKRVILFHACLFSIISLRLFICFLWHDGRKARTSEVESAKGLLPTSKALIIERPSF